MEITDKTLCLTTYDNIEIFLNPEQAEKIRQAIESGSKMITVGGSTISASNIKGIYAGKHIIQRKRMMAGEWFCRYGHWHRRHEQCGHGTQAGDRKIW